jgi:predicted O-methyltransferase YrrM
MKLAHLGKAVKAIPSMLKLWTRRTPSDPDGVVNFAMDNPFIRPAQVPSEFKRLADIVAEMKPKTVLEIGTYHGGTLFAFCKLADPTATIISLDLPGGAFGGGHSRLHLNTLRRFAQPDQHLDFLRCNSHDVTTLGRVQNILQGKSLDFLFIDGDHSYEGAKQDFDLYSPLVHPGGMIAFHDVAEHTQKGYETCEVSRVWHEIKLRYRHTEIIENPLQGWAGIGVVYT